jgi:hypothetical protein
MDSSWRDITRGDIDQCRDPRPTDPGSDSSEMAAGMAAGLAGSSSVVACTAAGVKNLENFFPATTRSGYLQTSAEASRWLRFRGGGR